MRPPERTVAMAIKVSCYCSDKRLFGLLTNSEQQGYVVNPTLRGGYPINRLEVYGKIVQQ